MTTETILTTICRIMVSLIVALHFPLQLNPGRNSILSLVRYFNNDCKKIISLTHHRIRYIAVTVRTSAVFQLYDLLT